MIKLTLLFGEPKDSEHFERYYAETHLPIAAKIQGVRRLETSRVVGTTDGSAPSAYRIAELYFDDAAHMGQVMTTPEAQNAVADLKNFASGGITTLISEIGEH